MINKPKNKKKRVLMALSGGIDSAVSLHKLLEAGYKVEAAFMKNWSSQKGLKYDECPWLIDRQDALRVAAFFGVPMHTLNFEKEYEKNVMNYFFNEYRAGRTPNPDVMCNKEIKFKMLYQWAMKHGFDYVATGHYAQIKEVNKDNVIQNVAKRSEGSRDPSSPPGADPQDDKDVYQASKSGEYQLLRSKDEFKDQTYFIYNIKTGQLPRLLFPIGSMKKSEVRKLAQELKLPNADKKESMGLCFVGKIRLKDFLDQKLSPSPGPIISTDKEKLGEHEGLAYYTVGQRQGIKIGQDGPWYVVRKEMKTNTLVVTNNPKDKALQTKQIEIHSVNWINQPEKFPAKLTGRYRHQGDLEKLTVTKLGKDHYEIDFDKPQTAIASGQSLVLYKGKQCLGGGVIV